MRQFVLLLCSVALPIFFFAQSNLQRAINTLADDPSLKHGTLGVAVIDVASGKTIAYKNANQSLIPASTLKVVTTATALKLLGADFRFKTTLSYDGSIANGVLNGNLYIKGFGDPTLGSDQMKTAKNLASVKAQFLNAVSRKGIRAVSGNIIGDGTYFNGNVNGKTWQWYDLGNYYGAGVWGLNLHENLYYLNFRQTARMGQTPTIANWSPNVLGLDFINQVTSASPNSGDNAYIYAAPYSSKIVVRGTIPAGTGNFKIKGAIPNPPRFAAEQLQAALQAGGISTSGVALSQSELQQPSTAQRKPLTEILSPTLLQIATRANHKSVNLYCESLIRQIGVGTEAPTSLAAGIKKMKTFWSQKGVKTAGWFLEDGSGLSARNGITPVQLAHILGIVARDKPWFNDFYSTLPVGGQSGTVSYMFKGTPLAGNIRVKSGSLERVRSFAGYVRTKDGRLLAFAILANNYAGSSKTMRQKLERLMVQLYDGV